MKNLPRPEGVVTGMSLALAEIVFGDGDRHGRGFGVGGGIGEGANDGVRGGGGK